jgi:hypothetical protein
LEEDLTLIKDRSGIVISPHASFADMHATLKRVSIREQILQNGLSGQGSRNLLNTLYTALDVAA